MGRKDLTSTRVLITLIIFIVSCTSHSTKDYEHLKDSIQIVVRTIHDTIYLDKSSKQNTPLKKDDVSHASDYLPFINNPFGKFYADLKVKKEQAEYADYELVHGYVYIKKGKKPDTTITIYLDENSHPFPKSYKIYEEVYSYDRRIKDPDSRRKY